MDTAVEERRTTRRPPCQRCNDAGEIDVPMLGIVRECPDCAKGQRLRADRRASERRASEPQIVPVEAEADAYLWGHVVVKCPCGYDLTRDVEASRLNDEQKEIGCRCGRSYVAVMTFSCCVVSSGIGR